MFIDFLINLITTLFFYGFAPMLLRLIVKTPIKKSELKAFHIICTSIIALFFACANSLSGEKVNFYPAIIWGTVFYRLNKSKFKAKGLLAPEKSNPPCAQENAPLETWYTCPDCGSLVHTGDVCDCKKINAPDPREVAFVFSHFDLESEHQLDDFPVHRRKRAKYVAVALAILCIVSLSGNVYQMSETRKLTDTLVEVTEERDRLNKEAVLKTETISQLSQKIKHYKEPFEFYNSNIRFIVEGSDYYHTYDCTIFQNEECFWSAHNIEFCQWLGYSSCPLCKRGRLVKITP